jgi:TolA-binding protein
LKNLESTLRKQGRDDAERLETLDQVNDEISRLRGQIEEISFVVQDLRLLVETAVMGQERRQLHDEARLKQIEGFLSISAPPMPEMSSSTGLEGVEDDPESVESPDQGLTDFPPEASGKLELAATHIQSGRQALARVILQKAVDDHAGAPELAEIRYRIGETWFNEKQWAKAVRAFEVVNTHHQKSNWSAWSMFRQGECFEAMGQGNNAKLFYEEVVRQHPKSDAAKQAKAMLKAD